MPSIVASEPEPTWMRRAFGTPHEEDARELRPDEAGALLPELAEGSMRPKVEAAVAIARAGGEALITALDTVEAALAGGAGTRVAA